MLTAIFFIVLMTIPLSWYLDGPMHREGTGPRRARSPPDGHSDARAHRRPRIRDATARALTTGTRLLNAMSLAAIHLLFIALSTLLADRRRRLGRARVRRHRGACSGLVYGVLSLVAVPLLLVYGVRVRRKLKALGAFSS